MSMYQQEDSTRVQHTHHLRLAHQHVTALTCQHRLHLCTISFCHICSIPTDTTFAGYGDIKGFRSCLQVGLAQRHGFACIQSGTPPNGIPLVFWDGLANALCCVPLQARPEINSS